MSGIFPGRMCHLAGRHSTATTRTTIAALAEDDRLSDTDAHSVSPRLSFKAEDIEVYTPRHVTCNTVSFV
jgi:hypothetical protein